MILWSAILGEDPDEPCLGIEVIEFGGFDEGNPKETAIGIVANQRPPVSVGLDVYLIVDLRRVSADASIFGGFCPDAGWHGARAY